MSVKIPADTIGQAKRLHRAMGTLARLMCTDPRVIRLYDEWLEETGLGEMLAKLANSDPEILPALWARAAKDPRQGNPAAAERGVRGDKVKKAAMEKLLGKLGLPYPWLTQIVMASFYLRANVEGSQTPGRIEAPMVLPTFLATVTVEAEGFSKQFTVDLAAMPMGRNPSENSLETVERNVDWLYRKSIKDPPETIYRLAKQHGVRRSVVQGGIKSARQLLDLTLPE